MIEARGADEHISNQRPGQIVKPLGLSAFFKSQTDLTTEAAQEITNGRGVSLHNGLSQQLAFEIEDGCRNGCLMNVKGDILDDRHGRPPSGRWYLAIPSYHIGAPFQYSVRRGSDYATFSVFSIFFLAALLTILRPSF